MAKQSGSLIPRDRIERAILVVRGEKVMLDADLVRVARTNSVCGDQFPSDFGEMAATISCYALYRGVVAPGGATGRGSAGTDSTCLYESSGCGGIPA